MYTGEEVDENVVVEISDDEADTGHHDMEKTVETRDASKNVPETLSAVVGDISAKDSDTAKNTAQEDTYDDETSVTASEATKTAAEKTVDNSQDTQLAFIKNPTTSSTNQA